MGLPKMTPKSPNCLEQWLANLFSNKPDNTYSGLHGPCGLCLFPYESIDNSKQMGMAPFQQKLI